MATSEETVSRRHASPALDVESGAEQLPSRFSELLWAATTFILSALLALVPLLFNSRFYYADDTQAGAYPIWVKIGESIREGSLPFFEPSRWMAGNVVAEGQWGTFNPVVWLIGLGATQVADGAAFSALVKVAALAMASTGTFLLIRSLGVGRPWALVGGLLAASTGFTVYIDAASWVTALFVWSLLPWVLWGLRAVGLERRNVLLAFVPGYLLITVGYVHGTLLLVTAVVGVLIETGLRRDRTAFIRAFIVSCLLGLVAIAVYLPGILAAEVSVRDSQEILNSNFMSPDLSGLASAAAPTGQPWLSGFWASPVSAPLMYVAWCLPALVLVDWRRVREVVLPLTSVFVVGLAAVALTFGPSEIGPLRFPARVFPYLALVIVVVTTVLLGRLARRPTLRFGMVALIWLGVSTYFAYSEAPTSWKVLGLGSLAAAVGIVGVGVVLNRRGSGRSFAAAAFLATGLVTLVQHQYFPISPLPDFGLPAEREVVRGLLSQAEGDTMVIGNPTQTRVDWYQTSYANGWLLADTTVTNVYSPVMHRAYAEDLCIDSHGVVCWESAAKLFEVDPITGRQLADLLSLSSVQILARTAGADPNYPVSDPYTFAEVPAGWREVSRDDFSTVWVRDEPVASAGGIVSTSEGLVVGSIEENKSSVSFRIEEVPADGGTLVFSRLDWPGYEVTNGGLAESARGYLLTIDVPADSAGESVVLSFAPKGWTVSLGSIATAVIGALGLALADSFVRLRRRKSPAFDAHRPVHL